MNKGCRSQDIKLASQHNPVQLFKMEGETCVPFAETGCDFQNPFAMILSVWNVWKQPNQSANLLICPYYRRETSFNGVEEKSKVNHQRCLER